MFYSKSVGKFADKSEKSQGNVKEIDKQKFVNIIENNSKAMKIIKHILTKICILEWSLFLNFNTFVSQVMKLF